MPKNDNPQTVRFLASMESLAAIRECGLDGATLCWDIMKAPEAHIAAVIERIMI